MHNYLYCDRASNSARLLAIGLGVRRIRAGSTFKVPATVINWGHSELTIGTNKVSIINPPKAVAVASNKLNFFRKLGKKVAHLLPYTEKRETALNWLDGGDRVVVRNKLSGHSGEGVVIVEPSSELPEASLYTRYIPKDTEWRIHVFQGKVIDIQRKARNRDVPDGQVNWVVRSHHNGFVYVRGDIDQYPKALIDNMCASAINVVSVLGLHFGAVDVIATKKQRHYILEVNTAPGLEGTTLQNYITVFKEILK